MDATSPLPDQLPDQLAEPPSRPAVQRRGLFAFVCLAAGLVLGLELDRLSGLLWLGLCCGLCAAALFARGWTCRVLLALATFALGTGWIALRVHTQSPSSLAALAAGDRVVPVLIRGVVSDAPYPAATQDAHPWTHIELDLREVQADSAAIPVTGLCDLVIAGRVTLQPGDRISARGYFIPVDGPLNPGERDDRPLARQDGRVGRISIESADLVSRWDEPPDFLERATSLTRRFIWHLRGFAARALASALQPVTDATTRAEPARTALLGALLLGQNDPALRPVTAAMSRLGQVHVLSISGFHLAVMAFLAMFLVRATGDRGWLEPVIVGLLVTLYLLLVPAQAPILRSGIMVLVLLAAEATGRRYDRLNLLGWIAIALLLWQPLDLWSPGFQLSFGITAALLWLGEPFHRRLFPEGVFGRRSELEAARDPGLRPMSAILRNWITGLISTSLLCWAVATPLVMYHIGIVSPFGAISSVLLVPVFTLILWVGFVVLILGVLFPGAAGLAGTLLSALGQLATWATLRLDGLPLSAVNTPRVSVAWTVLATLVLVLWFWRPRQERPRLWAASAVVLAWLVFTLAREGWLPPEHAAQLESLAVGDGSAVIIRSGDQSILWVAGGGAASSGGELVRAAPRAARQLGCWRVRTLVIAGGRAESMSRLPEVVLALGVKDVLAPAGFVQLAAEQPAGPQAHIIDLIHQTGAEVRPIHGGEVIRFASVSLALYNAGAGPDDEGEDRSPRGTLVAEVTVQPPSGPPRKLLLASHLGRRDFEALATNPRFDSLDVAQIPSLAISRATESWLRERGTSLVWRSEAPRLGVDRARGPAGVPARSTASGGAITIEIDERGQLQHRSFIPDDDGA